MKKIRLKYLAHVNPSTPAFEKLSEETKVTFLPMEAVWPGERLDITRQRTKREVAAGYTRFQDGDLLVPKITPTFEAGRAVLIRKLLGGVGAGTTELHVLRPKERVDSRFLFYVVNTHSFLKLGEAEMYGVAGQQRVPDDFLRDLLVSIPSSGEQRRIANFLDVETLRIDRLLGLREEQDAKLQERRYAFISEELVPGSLGRAPSSAMYSWLPDLPGDLPLVKLGYLCRIQNGLTVDGARNVTGDVVTRPYLRVANVQAGRLELNSVSEIAVPRAVADRCTLRRGDVLMTEGGDLDKLGRGAVWDGEIPDCLHQNHVFALRPDSAVLDARYLSLLTQTLHGRCYFESTGSKTTNLASTNSSKILGFPIPLPSLERQKRLVAQVEEGVRVIAEARALLRKQQALLAERRQALITAAVTGQFDVSTASGRNLTDVTDGVTRA
ncbi:restriction endonuclease subunit S [Streptomyces sp. NPDC058373]|uniref:restriction endonuclease subunit S n=1 Tax=Streptomyces sp. NPDC058373 TaxID=3346465 RepID=UPI003655D537